MSWRADVSGDSFKPIRAGEPARVISAHVLSCSGHEQQYKQERQDKTCHQRECRMKWMAMEETTFVGSEMHQRFHDFPP